jgi:hypothetical protein
MTDLHSITGAVSDDEAAALHRRGGTAGELLGERLTRVEVFGGAIDLKPFTELLQALTEKSFEAPPSSDGWLAPRVHHALRMPRRIAGDSGVWLYLAHVVAPAYLQWRWGASGSVAKERYSGNIHKQAIARLWWGAELLRSGDDYSRAERFFDNQDLPNSCLHRPFIRVRPVALALVDELIARTGGDRVTKSDRINDVARATNLWLGPLAVDSMFGYEEQPLDLASWRSERYDSPLVPPTGPPAPRVSQDIIGQARAVVGQICDSAGLHPKEAPSTVS